MKNPIGSKLKWTSGTKLTEVLMSEEVKKEEVAKEVPMLETAVSIWNDSVTHEWYLIEVAYNPATLDTKMLSKKSVGQFKDLAIEAIKIKLAELDLV